MENYEGGGSIFLKIQYNVSTDYELYHRRRRGGGRQSSIAKCRKTFRESERYHLFFCSTFSTDASEIDERLQEATTSAAAASAN